MVSFVDERVPPKEKAEPEENNDGVPSRGELLGSGRPITKPGTKGEDRRGAIKARNLPLTWETLGKKEGQKKKLHIDTKNTENDTVELLKRHEVARKRKNGELDI